MRAAHDRSQRPAADRRLSAGSSITRIRGVLPALIAALGREQSEFVRPALTRALAASRRRPRARAGARAARHAGRGLSSAARSSRRSATIARTYALPERSSTVAKLEARCRTTRSRRSGKIGDPASRAALAELQQTAPTPSCSRRLRRRCACLASSCAAQTRTISRRRWCSRPAIARLSDRCFAARSRAGRARDAGDDRRSSALLDAGVPAEDPRARRHRLGVGTWRFRNPGRRARGARERGSDSDGVDRAAARRLRHAVRGLRGGAFLRRGPARLLGGAGGSPRRRVAEALIEKLEF